MALVVDFLLSLSSHFVWWTRANPTLSHSWKFWTSPIQSISTLFTSSIPRILKAWTSCHSHWKKRSNFNCYPKSIYLDNFVSMSLLLLQFGPLAPETEAIRPANQEGSQWSSPVIQRDHVLKKQLTKSGPSKRVSLMHTQFSKLSQSKNFRTRQLRAVYSLLKLFNLRAYLFWEVWKFVLWTLIEIMFELFVNIIKPRFKFWVFRILDFFLKRLGTEVFNSSLTKMGKDWRGLNRNLTESSSMAVKSLIHLSKQSLSPFVQILLHISWTSPSPSSLLPSLRK